MIAIGDVCPMEKLSGRPKLESHCAKSSGNQWCTYNMVCSDSGMLLKCYLISLISCKGRQFALHFSSYGFHIECGNIHEANILVQSIVWKDMNEN